MNQRKLWLYQSSFPEKSAILALPKGMEIIWKTKYGLNKYTCDSIESRFGLFMWWLSHGKAEYLGFNWDISIEDHEYLFNTNKEKNTKIELPVFLEFLWNTRQDLQAHFNIKTVQGKYGLLGWWEEHGEIEYKDHEYLFNTNKEKNTKIELPVFLEFLWNTRQDLQAHFDIKTVQGKYGLLGWWEEHGAIEYKDYDQNNLPKYLKFIWNARQDLQNNFDIKSIEGRHNLLIWWREDGSTEYKELSKIIDQNFKEDSNLIVAEGINIIGFAKGMLGIGEDARMAFQACLANNIKATYVDPNVLWDVNNNDRSLVLETTNKEIFDISLFCLPPIEMLRLAIEDQGDIVESATYKIGLWPWELPSWPSEFNGIANLVDEIWAESTYIYDCFSSLGVPIIKMPPAVEIPKPTEDVRKKYGLPENTFLFYLMFDGNSWLTRKNPLAGIQAFQEAFDSSLDDVGLVIKAMNINANNNIWKEIMKIASSDGRIHIIEEKMSRIDVINFMNSCDSFISLHRSEGIGRAIAEAMLLRQAVIVSNFSGNTDFCNEENSALVDGQLVDLQEGDYIFHENQFWFEPSIPDAASKIKMVFKDKAFRDKISKNAHDFISTYYSAKYVGSLYKQRLEEIRNNANNVQ